MPRKPKTVHPPEQLCTHCKRRKRHKKFEQCMPCRKILIQDGVIKPAKRVPFLKRLEQYKTRLETGMGPQEIADDLDISLGYLQNLVTRARKLGHEVPTLPSGSQPIKVHGQGTRGIAGCKCELCRGRRKQYRDGLNRIEKTRKTQKQVVSTPMSSPPKTASALARVGHGEGSRGVAGCYCDLCTKVRLDYRRNWEEQNKKKKLANVAAAAAVLKELNKQQASVAQPGQSC